MMRDPLLLLPVAMSYRLKMLPSEFRDRASNWDIVQILAYERMQDEDWRKKQEREIDREKSRNMTPEQQRALLMAGLSNGND